MKIYHNPRCSKSRQTLSLIEEKGIDVEIIDYLNSPPSQTELDRVLKMLDMQPLDLIRKGESVYKELGLKEKTLTRKEAIRLMCENPKLIERPIVIQGGKAILGRPPENVNELF